MTDVHVVKHTADALARVAQAVPEINDALGPALDKLPYIGLLRSAYRSVQRVRLSLFLTSIAKARDDLTDADRERFGK